MKSPLLTVLVPAFNMEGWLEPCLQSLAMALASGVVEAIVVDDGSRDGTAAEAQAWVRRQPAVRVVHKPNGHYGSAVNAGLAVARGRYVKLLDADDTFDATGLAALTARLARDIANHAEIDLYLTDYDEVDAQGRTRRAMVQQMPQGRPFGVAELMAHTEELVMHACTWRVALLRAIGYRQSTGICYSDVEWILYPVLWTQRIGYEPVRVYRYLLGRTGQSVSLAERRRNVGAWQVLLTRIIDFSRHQAGALTPPARAYLAQVMVTMARMYLETAFVLQPLRRAPGELRHFLGLLSVASPEIARRLEDEAMILKGTLRIRYLRIWRRLPFGKFAWMAVVRGYLAVVRGVRRIQGKEP